MSSAPGQSPGRPAFHGSARAPACSQYRIPRGLAFREPGASGPGHLWACRHRRQPTPYVPCLHPLTPRASSQHPRPWHRPLPDPFSRRQVETAEPGRAHCPSSSHPCPSGGAAGLVSAIPSRPPSSRPVRASSVGSSVSLHLAGAGNAARMWKAGWPAPGVGGPGAGTPWATHFHPGQR